MNSVARAPRASVLWPGLFALLAFIVLIGLGTWQLERKSWKEALIAALDERLAAKPATLPPPDRWPGLDPASEEFRRVTFGAVVAGGKEALVYATGSAFRRDVSGPGYWVFAPLELPSGGTVVVNRGFVPEGQQGAGTHAPVAGRIELVGALRWPEPRGWFAPQDSPERSLFFVRDHLAIAAAKGWGAVAPFYVELETPTGQGQQLPRAGKLTPTLRNDHLQYAITWYGLAAVLVIVFAFWLRSRRREVSS